jgi:hypothetical protein
MSSENGEEEEEAPMAKGEEEEDEEEEEVPMAVADEEIDVNFLYGQKYDL